MAVLIKSIQFNNFRQYGNQKISFDYSHDHQLTAIIEQNGTGKTTLLRALNWCFYGNEYIDDDEGEQLPILNTDVLKKGGIGDIIPVSVEVTVYDEEKILKFQRQQEVKLSNSLTNIPNAVLGNMRYCVIEEKMTGTENPVVHTEDAAAITEQYFSSGIREFYFFNGEKLNDFFRKSNKVRDSVFNISQVTLLDNAAKHMRAVKNSYSRELAHDVPDVDNLLNQMEELSKKIKKYKEDIKSLDIEIKDLKRKEQEYANILREHAPIAEQQERRDALIQERFDAREELKIKKRQYQRFILYYTVCLNLVPDAHRALDIIDNNSAANDPSNAIDSNLLKHMIDHPGERCPVCNNPLGAENREYLVDLYQQLSTSGRTIRTLSEMRVRLIDFIHKAEEYPDRKEIVLSEYQEAQDNLKRIETELSAISQFLTGNSDTEEDAYYAEIEVSRQKTEQEKEKKIGEKAVKESDLEDAQQSLDSISQQVDQINEEQNQNEIIRKKIQTLDRLSRIADRIKEDIMNKIKEDVEIETWDIFESMMWKKNTFKEISISDEYVISVYDDNHLSMVGNMSSAEKMALAYAFMLAVHKASGKNCPMVIDYPLGRASDKNRESVAKSLLDVSKEKQIIMLFAPDEYSEPVRQLYDNTSDIQRFELTSDEKYIQEVR